MLRWRPSKGRCSKGFTGEMKSLRNIDALLSELCRGAAHFSVAPVNASSREALLREARERLTTEELGTLENIRSRKRGAEFLAGRIAAKRVLGSSPFDVPGNPSVRRTETGAPDIAGHPDIRISISHSGPYAVAVAAESGVGVDLERDEARPDCLIEHFYSDAEKRALSKLSGLARTRLANQLWCRKEAASKVVGLGGALPFSEIDCSQDETTIRGRRIALRSDVQGGYVAAIAYEIGGANG